MIVDKDKCGTEGRGVYTNTWIGGETDKERERSIVWYLFM